MYNFFLLPINLMTLGKDKIYNSSFSNKITVQRIIVIKIIIIKINN